VPSRPHAAFTPNCSNLALGPPPHPVPLRIGPRDRAAGPVCRIVAPRLQKRPMLWRGWLRKRTEAGELGVKGCLPFFRRWPPAKIRSSSCSAQVFAYGGTRTCSGRQPRFTFRRRPSIASSCLQIDIRPRAWRSRCFNLPAVLAAGELPNSETHLAPQGWGPQSPARGPCFESSWAQRGRPRCCRGGCNPFRLVRWAHAARPPERTWAKQRTGKLACLVSLCRLEKAERTSTRD